MASLNKVMLIGNLTRDPEVKYTPKGTALADLRLAVNRRFKSSEGESREEVTYLDVVVWDKRAEVIAKYLRKGDPIFIEGRLQMEQWEDKQTGQKRSKVSVVAENFEFLNRREGGAGESGGGEGGGGSRSAPRSAQRPQAVKPRPASDEFGEGPITEGMEEDNIPF